MKSKIRMGENENTCTSQYTALDEISLFKRKHKMRNRRLPTCLLLLLSVTAFWAHWPTLFREAHDSIYSLFSSFYKVIETQDDGN